MTWLDTAITAALIIYSFFIVIILIEYVSDRRGKNKVFSPVKQKKQQREALIPVTVERKKRKFLSPGKVEEKIRAANRREIGQKKNELKMPSEDRSPGVEKALRKMKQKKSVKEKAEKVSLEDPEPVLDEKGAPAVWKERNFE
jgi:hypothetical protein